MKKIDHDEQKNSLTIVAVSSCPTGVAHTFMAAKALEQEAQKRQVKIKVQKNASQGMIDQLTADEINQADYVIIAADIKVDLTPFNGKKVYKTSTKMAMSKPDKVFDELASKAEVQAGIVTNASSKKSKRFGENLFKGNMNIYQHILTGISFMLPFVIAGGVITAISFFWGI
jgi:PTS system fructose-specific IIC component